MKVLVTGASGLVGRHVCSHMSMNGYQVIGTVRGFPKAPHQRQAPDLADNADWSSLLAGQDAVIHCAARVHIMNDEHANPLSCYRAINRDATLRLARQAADAGVRRFIFISTAKVCGERSLPGVPLTEWVAEPPIDAYALSKYEAEQRLLALAATTSMEVVIIRPPLLYGEGVRANFAALLSVVRRGIPLPLASVRNRRTLLSVANLCDLILVCVTHPAAANQVFLVGDSHALSTPELVRHMASMLGVTPRLVPCPVWLLRCAGFLLGKQALIARLTGSFELDTGKVQHMLAWRPRCDMKQLRTDHFLHNK